jgi:hypothetical protein
MIFWGSFDQNAFRGVVADVCPNCGIRPFALIDRRRVSFVFSLPAGHGSVVATTRQCQGCAREMECHVDEYQAILPVYAARVLSMEQLLEQSNPKLSRGEPPPASPLHELAVGLPAKAPKGAGCLATILIGVPVGAVVILLSQNRVALVGQGQVGEVVERTFGAITVLLLIGPFILWRWLARRTYRRWFREEVIQPASARGIEPLRVLALLQEMKKSSPSEGREKDLFDQLWILERMLAAEEPKNP